MDSNTLGNNPQPSDGSGSEVSSELQPPSALDPSKKMFDRLIQSAEQIDTERPLIQQARKRDEEAWKTIWEDYAPDVAMSIHFYLSNYAPDQYKSGYLLQDLKEYLTAEVIIQAYWCIDKYEPDQPFITWLRGIAKNVCSNKCRELRKESELRLIHLGALPSDKEPFREYAYEKNPRREVVEQALNELSPPKRQVIALFFHGYNYEEIERITGYHEGNARMIVCRFRKSIKHLTGQDSDKGHTKE